MHYGMRDIDPVWWRLVKAKAAREGKNIRALIIELLNDWLKRKERVL